MAPELPVDLDDPVELLTVPQGVQGTQVFPVRGVLLDPSPQPIRNPDGVGVDDDQGADRPELKTLGGGTGLGRDRLRSSLSALENRLPEVEDFVLHRLEPVLGRDGQEAGARFDRHETMRSQGQALGDDGVGSGFGVRV